MKRNCIILALAVLGWTSTAQAKVEDSSWYVGGDVGLVNHGLDNMKVFENNTDWTDSYNIINDLDAKSASILAGYKMDNGIRLEGKYSFIKSDLKSFNDNVTGNNNVAIETEIHKIMADAFYDYDVSDKFSVYAGGGIGFSYIKVPTSVWQAGSTWGYIDRMDNDVNFSWELALGTAYEVSESMDLTLQYTYSDLGKFKWGVQGGNGSGGIDYFSGGADMRLSTISLGMRYKF